MQRTLVKIHDMSDDSFDFGVVGVVSGTSIGAGIVVLPIACMKLGFIVSLLLLISMFLIATFSAFKLIELCSDYSTDISGVARNALGFFGYVASLLSQMLLFFALIAAYMQGLSGILMHDFLAFKMSGVFFENDISLIPLAVCCICFFSLLEKSTIIKTNNMVVFVKLVLLLASFLIILQSSKTSNIYRFEVDFSSVYMTTSIFFTAFGFHGSIPYMMKGNGNVKSLKKSVFLGCFITFCAYAFWVGSVFSILDLNTIENIMHSVNPHSAYHLAIENKLPNGVVISIFSLLAIASSLIGVGLANMQLCRSCGFKGEVIIVFSIPLAMLWIFGNKFLALLSLGAIFLCIFSVLMPAIALARYREGRLEATRFSSFILFIIALTIIYSSLKSM